MCTRPGERDRSITSTKHGRGINVVPRNWNRHAHTDSKLGVVFKIDQSELRSTRAQNLDYDITVWYTGRIRTMTQHP